MGLIGAHVSAAGGIDNAPLRGRDIGCEAIQIFTKSQMQWAARKLEEKELEAFKNNVKDTGLEVIVHDSYLINLGSKDAKLLQKSRGAFLDEIKRCEALGIGYLVFHPGAHMGSGEEACLKTIAESMNWAIKKSEGKVMLLLENTAGQGSVVGYRFEHLASIIDRVNEKKLAGVCIDTCHTLAGGYNLKTKDGYEATMKELDKMVGLKRVHAFHMNDAKKDLGSRIDRHELIGKGFLGKGFFSMLVNDRRFARVPMVLETPNDDAGYAREIKLLKSLRK